MADGEESGGRRRRALFLDRDGVINVDRGYVARIQDFQFVDGIFDLVRAARARGLVPVVVTNQSGIARGYYTEADYHRLTDFMRHRFAEEGAPLERVYFCPYHPDAELERYRRVHPDRKPGPGMLLTAAAELGLDLAGSVMIGDQRKDAAAARAAGVGHIALVGDREPEEDTAGAVRLATLADALEWFLALE